MPDPKIVKELEARHGNEIKQQFSIEPSALTASEAQYLIGFKLAYELRNRAVKSEQERIARLHAKGISESQDSGLNEPANENHVAIQKRAKKEEWVRDLAGKIAAKSEELVNKDAVTKQVAMKTRITKRKITRADDLVTRDTVTTPVTRLDSDIQRCGIQIGIHGYQNHRK